METIEFTNRELSEALGVNFPKQKRHAREFLGVDPEAGQSSGVHRKLSVEQAFIVYFCGLAVNTHKVPLADIKKLAKYLPSWLEKRLYFPILKHLPKRLSKQPFIGKYGTVDLNDWEKRYLDWAIIVHQTNHRTIHTARGRCFGKVIEHFPEDGISFLEESHLLENIVYDGSEIEDEEVIHISHISVTASLRKFSRALRLNKL